MAPDRKVFTYKIPSVSASHSGVYSCNSYGLNVEQVFRVRVRIPLQAEADGRVAFDCRVAWEWHDNHPGIMPHFLKGGKDVALLGGNDDDDVLIAIGSRIQNYDYQVIGLVSIYQNT